MSTFVAEDGQRRPICHKCRYVLRTMTDEEMKHWSMGLPFPGVDAKAQSRWIAFLLPRELPYGQPCVVGFHQAYQGDLIQEAIADLSGAL